MLALLWLAVCRAAGAAGMPSAGIVAAKAGAVAPDKTTTAVLMITARVLR
jgi:hypothetical protein